MARVWVELPPGWGPQQVIFTAWRDAGYTLLIRRYPASGEVVMEVRG